MRLSRNLERKLSELFVFDIYYFTSAEQSRQEISAFYDPKL